LPVIKPALSSGFLRLPKFALESRSTYLRSTALPYHGSLPRQALTSGAVGVAADFGVYPPAVHTLAIYKEHSVTSADEAALPTNSSDAASER
jgi:hypothetical protein